MTNSPLPGSGNQAPYYIIFHFVFAYMLLSSRLAKNILGIDHNVNPRSDLTVYAARKLKEGKITKRQLNFLERNEACHANSMENFPVFVASVLFATAAGIDASTINYRCALYTVARIGYAVAYLTTESYKLSAVRTLFWYVGTLTCLTLLWSTGAVLNASM